MLKCRGCGCSSRTPYAWGMFVYVGSLVAGFPALPLGKINPLLAIFGLLAIACCVSIALNGVYLAHAKRLVRVGGW